MERGLPEEGDGRGGGPRKRGKIGIMVGALGKNGRDQFWSLRSKEVGVQSNMIRPFSSRFNKSLRTISATSQNEIELIFSECQPPKKYYEFNRPLVFKYANGSIVKGRSTVGLRAAPVCSQFF